MSVSSLTPGFGALEVLQERLPGERYIPANPTAGWEFLAGWCYRCKHDEPASERGCHLLNTSIKETPMEWRIMDDGQLLCSAFLPMEVGKHDRCPMTLELFSDKPLNGD